MMRFGLSRSFVRRLALALAALQLSAYALSPILEASTERPSGRPSIERAHTKSCVILHAPDTCLACQLLNVHAQRSSGLATPNALQDTRIASIVARDTPPARAPPSDRQSRAPPKLLA